MTDPIDLDAARTRRKGPKRPRAAPDDGLPPVDELNLEGFRCTDIGNAERLVTRFRGKIRYCYGRKKWLIWGEKRWMWDDGGIIQRCAKKTVRAIYAEAEHCEAPEIRQAIAKHARMSEKSGAISAMIALAQAEAGISVALDELDADPMLLNCENGTIDLASGALRQHDAADLITKMCPARYEPLATHAVFTRFLAEATDHDAQLQDYIQCAAGYAVQGRATERALFFIFGPPGSAKSTLIDALGAALGDYHVSSGRETWLVQKNTGGNRGDLVRLAGARLVTATEFRRGDRFDEGLIKAITGGDAIVHSAKFEAEVTIRPTFALWFAANAAPIIRDDDAGMWARMRRIPFDHVIPEADQDKSIKQTLQDDPEARAAILAWAVAGCLKWQRDGLGEAAAVAKSNEAYRAEMDPIGGFFELCKFEPDLKMTAGSFRKAYRSWCDDNGVKFMLERNEIENRLRPHGAKYVTIRGKQWVKGVDLIGEYEEPGYDAAGYRLRVEG